MATFFFVLILAAANIIQAITGFAGAPLAMPPCIALVGISDAKSSITFVFLVSCAVVTLLNIRQINWKKLALMILFMLIGMFPGLWLYDKLPVKILMILYGVIVVLIGLVKLLKKNSSDLKKPWNYGALILAGAMQGMFTSGGPFLVLYAASAMKDKKEFRATVSAVWVVLNIYLCLNMGFKGMYTSYSWKLVLLSAAPVAAAILIGSRIAKRIRQETFLKLVYVLLILSGATLLLNAFL